MNVIYLSDFNCIYSYIGLNRMKNTVSKFNLDVEWEMKSSILDYNLEAISRRSVEFVNSKSQKYSSIIGVIASSAVLTALNPAFLSGNSSS